MIGGVHAATEQWNHRLMDAFHDWLAAWRFVMRDHVSLVGSPYVLAIGCSCLPQAILDPTELTSIDGAVPLFIRVRCAAIAVV